MKRLEYWRWCYRDPQTGAVFRTPVAMTEEQARARYLDPQRLDGTRSVRYVDDEKATSEAAPAVDPTSEER